MKKLPLITAILLSSLTTVLQAAPEGVGPLRAELDTDGNGVVTREEIQAGREQAFADADTNGDGYLSMDEMTAMAESRRAQRLDDRMAQLDTNGDGAISAAEFISGTPEGSEETVQAIFDAFAGSDGLMSADELASLGSPEGQRDVRYIRMDTSGDGQIDLEEFTSVRPPRGNKGPRPGGQPGGRG